MRFSLARVLISGDHCDQMWSEFKSSEPEVKGPVTATTGRSLLIH